MPERPDDLLDIPSNFRRKDTGPAGPLVPAPIVFPECSKEFLVERHQKRCEREARREARLIREAAARFNRSVLRAERDKVYIAIQRGARTHWEVQQAFCDYPVISMSPRRVSAALQALVRTGRIVKVSRKRYKVKE